MRFPALSEGGLPAFGWNEVMVAGFELVRGSPAELLPDVLGFAATVDIGERAFSASSRVRQDRR